MFLHPEHGLDLTTTKKPFEHTQYGIEGSKQQIQHHSQHQQDYDDRPMGTDNFELTIELLYYFRS